MLAAVLHLTGLGWPNRPGPGFRTPGYRYREAAPSHRQAVRPQSLWASGHESRGRAPRTRCWACCPGASLNQKGQALDCPPPQTSPGLLPSPRAQHSHRIRLLRLSILQKAETNESWDEQGMQKRHTQGEHRRSVTLHLKFPLSDQVKSEGDSQRHTKGPQVLLTHHPVCLLNTIIPQPDIPYSLSLPIVYTFSKAHINL